MADTTQRRGPRRRSEQAVKISATITPKPDTARKIGEAIFGAASPLFVRGGRLTINAAVAFDLTKPGSAARAEARVLELKTELDAVAEIHSFTTAAGAVQAGSAEVLPEPAEGEGAE